MGCTISARTATTTTTTINNKHNNNTSNHPHLDVLEQHGLPRHLREQVLDRSWH
jgi:hypothetical protein